jgi:hypothetical protein
MGAKFFVTTVPIDFNTFMDDALFMYLMKSQESRTDPWCEDWLS